MTSCSAIRPSGAFSVLMSVYAGERSAWLDQALASLAASTVWPAEIVLVQDGPLGKDLVEVIERYLAVLPMTLVPLERNIGLGPALSAGLSVCRQEWVARFDTDDVLEPDRFERQLAYLREHPAVDIVGGWIREFESDPEWEEGKVRRVPETHQALLAYARRRNPFNHMTVMFRRELAMAHGGYQGERLYEDYALWVRMLRGGAVAANIPGVLVKARAGQDMFQRRGGLGYVRSEAVVQWSFYRCGFIGPWRLALNLAQRLPVRILPRTVRRWVYQRFLRA
ncbi:UDP-Gal:alpha-D-GlcNAc-diphosphoundecaprenol beta-1,3-galactosyltransferase [Achromobacter aegrifaciens]|uniref:glycosyltransferase n=1 Tax=Achromobacter aegrifaciens TaxID=1287736 RepID=UPI0014665BE5|nr:glycosyltransferase [Achromobacter aegrifaciens]CAB3830692.1 UDP-Gal:alpha-D-GlcNAc-diphosphoundecaprenol beta-1,3-galactosyltransferase [Achromobacter aegrifaciens]